VLLITKNILVYVEVYGNDSKLFHAEVGNNWPFLYNFGIHFICHWNVAFMSSGMWRHVNTLIGNDKTLLDDKEHQVRTTQCSFDSMLWCKDSISCRWIWDNVASVYCHL